MTVAGWGMTVAGWGMTVAGWGMTVAPSEEISASEGMHVINPLNTELNPICHLLALLGAHHILHVRMVRVKADICRSHVALYHRLY